MNPEDLPPEVQEALLGKNVTVESRVYGTILDEAAELVDGPREHDYGHPLDDFSRIVGMVNALFAHKLKEPFVAEDWPLIMECVKCSREVNEHKRDNAVDGAGYWRTLEKVADERARRER